MAGDTRVDHRVIPWEPTAPTGGYTGAAVHQNEQIAYRDTSGDIFIRPGRTMTVDVVKNVVDNTAPFLTGPSCAVQPFNTSEVGVFKTTDLLIILKKVLVDEFHRQSVFNKRATEYRLADLFHHSQKMFVDELHRQALFNAIVSV